MAVAELTPVSHIVAAIAESDRPWLNFTPPITPRHILFGPGHAEKLFVYGILAPNSTEFPFPEVPNTPENVTGGYVNAEALANDPILKVPVNRRLLTAVLHDQISQEHNNLSALVAYLEQSDRADESHDLIARPLYPEELLIYYESAIRLPYQVHAIQTIINVFGRNGLVHRNWEHADPDTKQLIETVRKIAGVFPVTLDHTLQQAQAAHEAMQPLAQKLTFST